VPRPDGLARLEGVLYLFFAGVCVLLAARLFYGSLRLQLFYSSVRPDPYLSPSDWSAPLDDVFIHFDFARSVARGHPFEWSSGNGYSSGGTSLLYPFVLAPGLFLGFVGDRLMQFAAIVATTSTFATLIGSRRLFRALPPWTKWLAPPALLAVGALDWSLFSGMEVAFFLAVWALSFVAWDDLVHGVPGAPAPLPPFRGALVLGLANGVLAATRPEATIVVVVLGVTAALALRKRHGVAVALVALALSGVFAAMVVVGQAVANRVFTGDWSAAGALVKLEMYDPRLTRQEVWDAWLFHVRYQIGRVTGYHVGGALVWGCLLWVLAALPLFFKRTRKVATVLWVQSVLWVLVVALNGQVRWQNERYTMPALAWMLLAAALGVGAACTHAPRVLARARAQRVATWLVMASSVGLLAWRQVPRMRDQAWFFGRASRNIRDQHMKVGRRIRHEIPTARRVLVGDAGAIPYTSDLPALDIIGLGGYPGLPFARASRWGVAAAIELIERMPPMERPDIMAIYPGWWGDFPLWFGRPLDGVSVRGNVICGGLTKMMYAARWDALDAGRKPATALPDHHFLADEVDFGDLLNEAEHGYRITGALGFVAMKLLERPGSGGSAEKPLQSPSRGLWDAGRVVPPGASVSFTLRELTPRAPTALWIRTAPPQPTKLKIQLDGADVSVVSLAAHDGWDEEVVALPAERVGESAVVTIAVEQNEVVLYHLWGVQRR
jgi:hypothetical protein